MSYSRSHERKIRNDLVRQMTKNFYRLTTWAGEPGGFEVWDVQSKNYIGYEMIDIKPSGPVLQPAKYSFDEALRMNQ